jgi:hypothetical protein
VPRLCPGAGQFLHSTDVSMFSPVAAYRAGHQERLPLPRAAPGLNPANQVPGEAGE